MSLLDDARRLADVLGSLRDVDLEAGLETDQFDALKAALPAMPRIVAALEAAKTLMDFDTTDTPQDDGYCWFCHQAFVLGTDQHAPDCPWQALAAALKGEEFTA